MSNAIAVGIVPGEVSLLVARANGAVEPLHQLSAALPEGAVRAGLQAPNVIDGELVAERLGGLAAEAGGKRERGGLVAVLLSDAAVRLALVPLEGADPRPAEGDAMARWALADLLPVAVAEARIDWSVVVERGGEQAARWLLAVGADVAVVREYEAVVEHAGWTPGRVVPLTLALAVGADDAGDAASTVDPTAARIVLSGMGGQVACLVEARGVPRLHRAWRGSDPELEVELPAVQRYVHTRLGLGIVDAVVAGPDDWRRRAAAGCAALGWTVRQPSAWAAHLGAVRS